MDDVRAVARALVALLVSFLLAVTVGLAQLTDARADDGPVPDETVGQPNQDDQDGSNQDGGEPDAIPPVVIGAAVVGQTLSVGLADWVGVDVTHQWFADDEPIVGATEPQWVVHRDQLGQSISVEVRRADDDSTVRSAGTDPVQLAPGLAGTVSVTGVAVTGGTLTATTRGWDGVTLTHQWYADGVVLSGQTSSTLRLADAHIGRLIRVEVTGNHPDRTPVIVAHTVGIVAPRPLTAATPVISGTAAVGSTLTAKPGTWTSGSTLSYQWYASGTAIAGARSNTLKLTATQAGKTITVKVTGSRAHHTTVTTTSAATPKVVTPGTPMISGSAVAGSTLSAAAGTWASGTTIRYQWLADGAVIKGATSRTFSTTTAHSGKAITVRITATRSGWATVERTSAATARVMRTTTPKISGSIASGLGLTAQPGTWTSGTTFSYQWYIDGKAVKGATKKTFTLTKSHVGKKVAVKITGRKSGHPTVGLTSAQTGKVTTSAKPTISGELVSGSTLTAKAGTWAKGTSLRYQWLADGTAIKGATKKTFKLGSAQRGKKITVAVTGKKSGYATVTRTSSATARIATVAKPKISGSVTVTSTLTASPGTWTKGTTFKYQWYVAGKAVKGATKKTFKLTTSHVGKKVTVKVTGRLSGYPTVARTSAATTVVSYPTRTKPASSTTCPSWAPIKGNQQSMIYHLPRNRFYKVTKPEACFRTEAAAHAAGYRAAKV